MVGGRRRGLVLLVVGVFCLLLAVGLLLTRTPDKEEQTLDELLLQLPLDQLDDKDLYISHNRRQYDGSMRLSVPSAGVDTLVGATTEPLALRSLPGLYEFSQMPGEPEGNVSIAGHRDIFNMEFYHLDQVGPGDELLLEYEGQRYRYRFAESKVVEPDDWDIIRRQGAQMITLTTCDPIGTAQKRLVVTGILEDVTAV